MRQRCICRDLRNGLWRTWFVLGNGSKPTAEPLPPGPACRPNLHPRHAGRCVGSLRSCAYMTFRNSDRRQAFSACWPGAWDLPQFPVDYHATWWVSGAERRLRLQYEPIRAGAQGCATSSHAACQTFSPFIPSREHCAKAINFKRERNAYADDAALDRPSSEPFGAFTKREGWHDRARHSGRADGEGLEAGPRGRAMMHAADSRSD
jgi:hypothetical protein